MTNVIPEYYEKLTPVGKLVGDFGLADAHKDSCWQKLCEHFSPIPFENYDKEFEALEERLLLDLELSGADVRSPNGKLSLNKAMKSSTYRSAKSVLKKGALRSITYNNPDGTGFLGKTAYEKKIKTQTTSGPANTLEIAAHKTKKVIDEFLAAIGTDEDKEKYLRYLESLVSDLSETYDEIPF